MACFSITYARTRYTLTNCFYLVFKFSAVRPTGLLWHGIPAGDAPGFPQLLRGGALTTKARSRQHH